MNGPNSPETPSPAPTPGATSQLRGPGVAARPAGGASGGYDLDALRARLSGIELRDDAFTLKRRSRDHYWFSPIARAALDGKRADLIVLPRNVDEVMAVAAACAALRIPLTVRGAGTGTYGQAVPLHGGVVLDTSGMQRILGVTPERVRAEAGARIAAVDAAANAIGRELHMHPSTKHMATIGGYVCGGSGGIGSIRWGGLREPGNLCGASVVTLEETPRWIELTGSDANLVNRTFGSTGIVVAVELPLAPARSWLDMIALFDDFAAALEAAHAIAADPSVTKKLVSLHAPESARWLAEPSGGAVEAGKAAVLLMVDAADTPAVRAHVAAQGGTLTLAEPTAAREARTGALPVYELAWGHTTLHAIRKDRTISYLQTLFPPGRIRETALQMHATFGAELPLHMEFILYEGQLAANGAQLWPYSSPDRLAEIIAIHEAAGVPVANPHVFTVEEGSRHKRVPGDQLAFKAEVDPHGLLNPGKMTSYRPIRP